MSLTEGMKAPAFKELVDYKGKWMTQLVVHAKPVILGVSRDDAESHQDFKKK